MDSITIVWNRCRKPLISLFILSYMVCISLWVMAPSKRRDDVIRSFEPAVLWAGLWQSYDVFSPNPRDINLDLEGLVTFDDGSTTIWKYPRMEQMGIVERVIHERWRKLGHDHLNWEKEKQLWPDFARFIARTVNSENKHPASVVLVRHWIAIPKPKDGFGKPLPPHTNRYEFYSYKVQEEDLK